MAKLWGGRFSKKPDPLVERFTRSVQFDHRLAAYDIIGSIIHVQILGDAGYLNRKEAARLIRGLSALHRKVKNGTFTPAKGDEDIHTSIQNQLGALVGEVALKLHTARSRNDQVAFSTKLYCKEMISRVRTKICDLSRVLTAVGEANKTLMMPGFTHLQHAQPVLVKDHLDAYAQMLSRDAGRLQQVSATMRLVMGAGAVAGTPIPAQLYQRTITVTGQAARLLGAGPITVVPPVNSLDTVSDRDFVIEVLSALAIMAMHLSRLAEDLILWASSEFDFVDIDEAFCTGSSLMPQKKNPDVLELSRGYAGRVCGNLVAVLTMMKGLPLTYNRDMQLDKEPLFEAFDVMSQELDVLTGLIRTLRFKKDVIGKALADEALYATDLVYYLVDKKIAFKDAHTIVGRLVSFSLTKKIPIARMTQEQLAVFSPALRRGEIAGLFDPAVSVRSKRSVRRQQKSR